MKNWNFLTAAALFALLAGPAAAQDALKIGFITTLSGPAGYLGQDIRDGLQLAIDMEGGKLGGVPVQLVVQDDGLKPATGREIAEKYMSDQGIKLLTGIVFSNVLGAVLPDVVNNGAIYISPNAAPSNFAGVGCNPNYFVVSWQNDVQQGASGAAANILGFKRAFVLAPNYQAGKDAITGFKRLFKGQIAGELYTQLDQTDFSSEMAQIRAAKPDMVYEFEPGGLGIAFVKQYAQAGLNKDIPLVLSESSTDAELLKAVGPAAVGIRAAAHWNSDFDNPSSKAFVVAWDAAYHRPVTYYSSQGYDTGLLIASALKATGKPDNIDAFRAALRKADFKSVRGDFAFGPNQHPVQDWYLLEIKAGAEGNPVAVTKQKILDHYGDPYAAACKM